MPQPTHVFLRFLSSILNPSNRIESAHTDAEPTDSVVMDGSVQIMMQQNPIPPATGAMGGASLNARNTGSGFRYGAAFNPRW
jgi:hypothetical protein